MRLGFIIILAIVLFSCKSKNDAGVGGFQAPPPQNLPVLTLAVQTATTYQEFSASLEGSKDIEVRPQVEGYLERIFVDEGARVRKGQTLFQINSRPFVEQLNNAKANLAAARANLANAQINVDKLTPLVQNNIISDVQLKTAQSAYNAAAASVSQAEALVSSAQINLGYASIKAPVDGYIGRIPYKTGSLVGMTSPEPLTVVSELREVYAYFSLSEKDFLQFKDKFPGGTIEEKIKQMPPVDLVLADNSIYPQKGKVQTVSGQFNNSMGTISFRASFPNTNGLLRSGNTGKIRVPQMVSTAIPVPQEATYELQDKVFVFLVADSNKVESRAITVVGKTTNYYLVSEGVKAGDKIVYSGIGLGLLQDGMVIIPQPMSMDSLLKTKPL